MNIRSKIFGGGDPVDQASVIAAKKPKGVSSDKLNSIAVAREEHRRGNTRSDDRHRLPDEPVRITCGGESHQVQLINLSGGGAMVRGAFQPKLWDKVALHLGDDGVIECAVRWLKDDRIGLEFAHETRLDCSADEQASLLREVIANSFPEIMIGAPAASTAKRTGGEEQRVADRHPLIWSGVLHYDFTSAPTRLRNISSSGALVELQVPLPVGAEPLLDLGSAGTLFCSVSWIVGDQAGLKFQDPFDLGRLARSRPAVAPAKWQRPGYLEPEPADDTPWAKEWGRKSLAELRDELEGFMKR